MNTVPASTFSANLRALLMSFVKTPDAKPYSVAFALFKTPSMSLKKKRDQSKLLKSQKEIEDNIESQ